MHWALLGCPGDPGGAGGADGKSVPGDPHAQVDWGD